MINIYYNPLDTACKSITGGICEKEEIQFNLFFFKETINHENIGKSLDEAETPTFCDAFFLLRKDEEDEVVYLMERTNFGFHLAIAVETAGLYFYRFRIVGNDGGEFCPESYINCGKRRNGYLSDKKGAGAEFQLLVYHSGYRTPQWFKGGILYQIFPDRFCKMGTMPEIEGRIKRADWGGMPSYKPDKNGKIQNKDFFGGNLKGIQSKLGYLKSLGITAIYFNPIFEAASNHRYDTSDYKKIDPMLGNEEDFCSLIVAAEKIGIRIILDGVFNHTGDDSIYFNKYGRYSSVGAYQSRNSPYYSWYTFQNFPDDYECWWGIKILPQLNESSENYQRFIFEKNGVINKWLNFGIGGYRLDVADELPDFFIEKLRETVKKNNPDALIIGEVWEDASNKISYSQRRRYLQGKELDSVMNYPLKEAIIRFIFSGRAEELSETVCTMRDNYPKQTLDCLMNILGTHDTARILTVLGEKICYTKDEMASPEAELPSKTLHTAKERLKTAALLQYTLPGVPCVYYGDENGQQGHGDPFCRKCFDWENIDEELLAYYRRLGEIRNKFREIFIDGEIQEIFVNCGCYFFKRYKNNKSIYIFANVSTEKYLIRFPKQQYIELLSQRKYFDCLNVESYMRGILLKIN